MSNSLPLVQQFLDYLVDERHFSPYTARCYGLDLRQYGEFLADEFGADVSAESEATVLAARLQDPKSPKDEKTVTGLMLAADVTRIRGFLGWMADRDYSAATTARKIATLRSFHKWMEKRGLVDQNPMLAVRTPKQAKRLPKAVSVEQIEQLLAAPDDSALLGARDRAILETLYSTGIRVSEVVGINRGDLDDSGESILIRGKGRRERVVPLGSHALAALRHYVNRHDVELAEAELTAGDESALFVNISDRCKSCWGISHCRVRRSTPISRLDEYGIPTTRLTPEPRLAEFRPGQFAAQLRPSRIVRRPAKPLRGASLFYRCSISR